MPALGNCRFRVARSRGRAAVATGVDDEGVGALRSGNVQAGHVGDGGVVDPEAPAAQRGQQFGVGRIEQGDVERHGYLTRSVLTTKDLPATPGSMVEDGTAGYGISRPTIS